MIWLFLVSVLKIRHWCILRLWCIFSMYAALMSARPLPWHFDPFIVSHHIWVVQEYYHMVIIRTKLLLDFLSSAIFSFGMRLNVTKLLLLFLVIACMNSWIYLSFTRRFFSWCSNLMRARFSLASSYKKSCKVLRSQCDKTMSVTFIAKKRCLC